MLRRSVSVRIECALPDLLIRRAAKEGIGIRRVARIDPRTMDLLCREADARALLEMCGQFRIDARIIGAAAREPLLRRMRKRWTLLIGIALCAAMMILFLGRIWEIRIRVDDTEPAPADRQRILAQCAALDIGIGSAVRGADTDLLRKRIAANLPDLKYAGAHLEGIRLCIDAYTETPAPKTFEISAARDIVAARDGIILSVEADSGHACVQAGDAVRAGQTLILGEEAVSKEETAPVGAGGRVIAKCWFEGKASGRTEAVICRRTGRIAKSTYIQLMDFILPLSGGCDYAQCETERSTTPIGGILIPLALVSETHYETENAVARIDDEALRNRLAVLARSEARRRLSDARISDAQIADTWENTEIIGTDMHVHAVYEIITDIATTRDDLTKEVHAAWKAMNK